ncbi:MAG: efflux RND transporter permease subunit [Chloroflexi bacterium]|nr:efflux RND transporter permease subunit [Chloroflexota bacterium]
MWITQLAVRRPLVIVMAFLAVVLLGVLAYTKLGVGLYPKTNFPYVSVVTQYPGASPSDVETFVTKPIEDALAGLTGLKHMGSSSAESVSYVNLEFEVSASADTATTDTERALAAIRATLPEGAKPPVVRKYDFAGPIMFVSLQGDLSPTQLFTLVDQRIKGRLERVPGVSQVTVIGGQEREVQVQFDPAKLRAYGVSVDQLAAAPAVENVTIPSGQLVTGGRAFNTRLVGLFASPSDLLNVAIGAGPAGTIYLRDVAVVVDTTKKVDLLYRVDGRTAIGLVVSKTSEANTVETSRGIRREIAALGAELPPEASLLVSFDSAVFVNQALQGVQENLMEAVLLTGLVLLLFLHTWRSTAIVLLAIPTSLVATYAVMYLVGFSLNQLTLLALALSIGVLVDDSIVILENIFRHLSLGKDPRTAALDGRSEIGVAALAITLVDVVVYAPLGFLTGMIGQFFREFGFSVVAAVLFSLAVSFTLTPMLASRWLRPPRPEDALGLMGRFGSAWDAGFARLEQAYERVLAWSLGHRKAVAAVSFLSVALAFAYFPLGLLGTEFVPNADQGMLSIQANLPAGSSLEATDRAARALESQLAAVPEIEHVLTSVGRGNPSGFQQQSGSHLLEMTVLLRDRSERSRAVDQLLPDVNAALHSVPGLDGRSQLPSASGAAQPLVIRVSGDDPVALAAYGERIEQLVRSTPGTADVTNSLAETAVELDAVIDHARASDLGVRATQAAAVLRAALTGDVVTQLRPTGEKEVDVRLISRDGRATSIEDLRTLPVMTSRGTIVRLDQVATVTPTEARPRVDRRDRRRLISVGAGLDGSRSLGEVTTDLQQRVAALKLPSGYVVDFGGDAELQEDSFNSFGIALVLGMIFMYMLMVALFESLLYPLAVMFSVPVSLFGAFTALVILRENLGLFSLIGLIMLLGLVAKNAILVIDFTERLRREGLARREALLRAGPIRLRPILMTSATLVVAMAPLALKLTVGAESRSSIGAVVGGGMISSTLLSLILVPVVYSTLDDLKVWASGARRWRMHRPRPGTATTGATPEPTHAPVPAEIAPSFSHEQPLN